MLAAEHLGVDLVNLGLAGGAHLEAPLADWIASRTDWGLMTMELGINLVDRCGVEEFARRVASFVPTVARAHTDKWIFCIDMFTFRKDFEGDPKAAEFRRVVREEVVRLGLPRLVHVAGTGLLSRGEGLTPDLVHPSPYGMEEIARNLASLMRRTMEEGG
jgi:hypothetical protein